MPEYIIKITDEEEKALRTVMTDIQEWIENAVGNRIHHAVSDVVRKCSDKNPDKINEVEKMQIVKDAEVVFAENKNNDLS